jgi:hypothetical protein
MSDVAIAEMAIRHGLDPDLDALRARYPELAFFFNHVEDARAEHKEELANAQNAKHEAEGELVIEINQLEDRNQQLRNAALQIAYTALLMPGKSHAEAQKYVTMINEIVKDEVE